MSKVSLLEKSDEVAYEDFLDECPFVSVQSSLDWRRVIQKLGEDEPYFITAKTNDRIIGVLPLYLYRSKLGNLLTTNAWHTISGITCSKEADRKSVCMSLLGYALTLAKELDCSVLSVGTNPFLDEKDCYSESLRPDYVMENFVQYIPLNEIFDEKGNVVHPNYLRRSNLSRNLNRAKLQPIEISDEQCKDKVAKCFKVHEKRMKELGTAPIPKNFFDSVLENLTMKRKGKFLFAMYEGKMVGGCLFLSSKEMMDIYMMSMDSEFCRLGTNFILTYHMLKWAHASNIPIFHWMSSPLRGDGVYKWKEQWGSRERKFLYFTKVIGDISQIQKMDYDDLGNAYRFHYLLPFNLLRNPNAQFTTKNELTLFMQDLSRDKQPAAY